MSDDIVNKIAGLINENDQSEMKITQLEVDWKDDFSSKDISSATHAIGGGKFLYDYNQVEVDSKVMFVSSHSLTDKQLDELWEHGDLWTGDKIWVGNNFKDIIGQIKNYVEEQNKI